MSLHYRCLIVHPFKPIPLDGSTGFSAEMLALQSLLQHVLGPSWSIQIADQPSSGYQLRQYDAIWLSCFGDTGNQPGFFEQLANFDGQIYWLANDPAYCRISRKLMPHTDNLHVMSAFPWQQFEASNDADWWVPGLAKHTWLPLWQWAFKEADGRTDHLVDAYYALGYAGYDRSLYRKKRLMHYMGTSKFATATWGVALYGAERHTNMPTKLDYRQIKTTQRQCLGVLIAGEQENSCLWPYPHRLLQAWHSGVLGFCDAAMQPRFDANSLLNLLVVATADDVRSVLKLRASILHQLIEVQYAELKNSIAEPMAELKAAIAWS